MSAKLVLRLLSFLLAAMLMACAPLDPPLVPMEDEWPVMGTVFTATVYRPDRDAAAARGDLDAAFSAVADVDAMMSLYKENSALSALNRAAGRGPVEVPVPVIEVLEAAQFYGALSDGAVDVTVQPLVDLWGFFDVSEATVPSSDALRNALSRVGMDRVTIDPLENTVGLEPDTHIDLGAIAKGYAVDQAISALKARGVPAALVNLGGMVAVFGPPPNGEAWVIGVSHPREAKLLGEIRLRDGAVATSGDYDRYFEVDGRRYSHIIDPRTGWPMEGVYAVTVVAPNGMAADALSTAAFVLGLEDGLALLDDCTGVDGFNIVPASSANAFTKTSASLGVTVTPGLLQDTDVSFTAYEGQVVQSTSKRETSGQTVCARDQSAGP